MVCSKQDDLGEAEGKGRLALKPPTTDPLVSRAL